MCTLCSLRIREKLFTALLLTLTYGSTTRGMSDALTDGASFVTDSGALVQALASRAESSTSSQNSAKRSPRLSHEESRNKETVTKALTSLELNPHIIDAFCSPTCLKKINLRKVGLESPLGLVLTDDAYLGQREFLKDGLEPSKIYYELGMVTKEKGPRRKNVLQSSTFDPVSSQFYNSAEKPTFQGILVVKFEKCVRSEVCIFEDKAIKKALCIGANSDINIWNTESLKYGTKKNSSEVISTDPFDKIIRTYVFKRGHLVTCGMISHTGKYAAIGFEDDCAIILDILNNNRTRPKIIRHGRPITALSFSHDDSKILTKSSDPVTKKFLHKIWDVQSGSLVEGIPFQNSTQQVLFSPCQSLVFAATEDNEVKVYNIISGELLGTFDHGEPISTMVISRFGMFIATVSIVPEFPTRSQAKVWDIQKVLAIKEALSTLSKPHIQLINKLSLEYDSDNDESPFEKLCPEEAQLFENLPKVLRDCYD